MTLTITQGNITYAETDAIVNAANDRLAEGGGVCGAIFGAVSNAGGPDGHRKLTQACREIGHCPTGDAVITSSYGLKAAHIIHAVGPIWAGRKGAALVAPLTDRELKQVDELVAEKIWQNESGDVHVTLIANPGIQIKVLRNK